MRETISLAIGAKIGHVEVIGPLVWINGQSCRRVRCACGKEFTPQSGALRGGRTTSCGCIGRQFRTALNTRHGQSGRTHRTATYSAWDSMLQRCTNPNSPAYAWYGARGITVHPPWRDFACFFGDMGECPPGKELERINNWRGYDPWNCVWAARSEQMRNTRYTRLVNLRGESMCVRDAARKLGIPADRIYGQVHRKGITHQEALDAILGPAAFPGGR